jgi:hypothetical protein
MQPSLMQWLASVGWTAFTWALAGLLLLNVGAVALLILRRDRHAVQRYTSFWLAGNLLLVAVGVGIPAITAVARLALLGASTVVPEIVLSS